MEFIVEKHNKIFVGSRDNHHAKPRMYLHGIDPRHNMLKEKYVTRDIQIHCISREFRIGYVQDGTWEAMDPHSIKQEYHKVI